jgi:pyrroline-5-carboxylate reductase
MHVDRATHVAFIGPGVMAEAMISGLINKKVVAAKSIVVSGPNAARVAELSERYAVLYLTDNAEAAKNADVIVLAVKPQRLDRVMPELCGAVKPSALVISIVAGATIDKIAAGLDHGAIVRSMPNTPAQIGEGITVWTAAETVSDEQKEISREILKAFGDEIFLDEERFLDMATALSGTGPAYVFLFMEAMVDAGVHLGFSRRVAEVLVAKTVRGSPVLPREGGFPDRHFSGYMGGLRKVTRAWSRLERPLAGDDARALTWFRLDFTATS